MREKNINPEKSQTVSEIVKQELIHGHLLLGKQVSKYTHAVIRLSLYQAYAYIIDEASENSSQFICA